MKGVKTRYDTADYETCRTSAKQMCDVGHAIVRQHNFVWRGSLKDVIFLSQKAEPATLEDKQIAVDLLDTLKAHEGECVGMVYPTRRGQLI